MSMRHASVGGTLTFRLPYCGRATFDWWLDASGHDVLVECTDPWRGLRTDIHQIGMGPKFSTAEARELAEKLCRKIINNLEFVIEHYGEENLELKSFYDNKQLPLYRQWAWEEKKRRFLEIGLLAEALQDDDEDDDSPENTISAKHEEQAKKELKSTPVEVIGEIGPLSGDELSNHNSDVGDSVPSIHSPH